ncbi:Shedu anti-phage system protein SduA domain-containing protein [Aeromicrobium stalagmiti]|uniref:Shedu anti-phage system protein SduA domain-containing protein n=1 Tax=Aeromicrobium stalagmiti TaxID=2738988 RepID=UPI0015681D3D|nr:Shedu anti-phage system protein SduA domain-containing protein [Aeromicrobium stalagmiti]NRQ49199.1 DUF4263 domain-containing protein [Aeromicrobium stalagmiti]
MELDLEWDRQIWWRRGAPQRLCGISVFYDFAWLDVFADERTHFRHGQRLAEGVQERCPEGLEAALLLTRRTDVAQGLRTTPNHFIYVLNIDEWLAAEDDFSLAYLATHLSVEPEDLSQYADLSLIGDPAEVSKVLDQQLTVDRVAEWLQQDGERIERLAGLVDFRLAAPTDVDHALDVIEALGDLDERQIQKLVDFVSRLTDADQRAALIRGATTDQPGRAAAAVVLHERVAERVADAGRDLEAYRTLLNNPLASETNMQDFLATHPLLFGLEYASIRPQQSGPSGSMDFLLERFDGYNDVVELKGPNEPILRSRQQTPGSAVPTPHHYRLGKELAHALPQALAYRDRLSRHPGAAEEFHGIRNAREPRLLIILGRQSALADHERLVLLELNRSLHRAEVVPYDVIAQRAEVTLTNISSYLGLTEGSEQPT